MCLWYFGAKLKKNKLKLQIILNLFFLHFDPPPPLQKCPLFSFILERKMSYSLNNFLLSWSEVLGGRLTFASSTETFTSLN